MHQSKTSFDQIWISTKQNHHWPWLPSYKWEIPSFVHSLQNHREVRPLACPYETTLYFAMHPHQNDRHQWVYPLLQSLHAYEHIH